MVRDEKIVKGKQCTIPWHVDNPKVSHVDSDIISSFLADIDAEYGKIAKMTITWGKIRKYLSMTIDCYSPEKAILLIAYWFGKMINETQ